MEIDGALASAIKVLLSPIPYFAGRGQIAKHFRQSRKPLPSVFSFDRLANSSCTPSNARNFQSPLIEPSKPTTFTPSIQTHATDPGSLTLGPKTSPPTMTLQNTQYPLRQFCSNTRCDLSGFGPHISQASTAPSTTCIKNLEAHGARRMARASSRPRDRSMRLGGHDLRCPLHFPGRLEADPERSGSVPGIQFLPPVAFFVVVSVSPPISLPYLILLCDRQIQSSENNLTPTGASAIGEAQRAA